MNFAALLAPSMTFAAAERSIMIRFRPDREWPADPAPSGHLQAGGRGAVPVALVVNHGSNRQRHQPRIVPNRSTPTLRSQKSSSTRVISSPFRNVAAAANRTVSMMKASMLTARWVTRANRSARWPVPIGR